MYIYIYIFLFLRPYWDDLLSDLTIPTLTLAILRPKLILHLRHSRLDWMCLEQLGLLALTRLLMVWSPFLQGPTPLRLSRHSGPLLWTHLCIWWGRLRRSCCSHALLCRVLAAGWGGGIWSLDLVIPELLWDPASGWLLLRRMQLQLRAMLHPPELGPLITSINGILELRERCVILGTCGYMYRINYLPRLQSCVYTCVITCQGYNH